MRLILRGFQSNETTSFDDISAFTAEYCIDLITNGNKFSNEKPDKTQDQATASSSNLLKTKANKYTKSKTDAQQTALHTLTLLKHIVHHFGLHTLKKVGECLLRCITLNDIVSFTPFEQGRGSFHGSPWNDGYEIYNMTEQN